MDCIFCKIAQKEAPAEIVYEDKEIIAFENIRPLAPTHVLIIPKKHIESVNKIKEEDIKLIGHIWIKIKDIAKKKNIEKGYKVAVNVEKGGGQEIFHLHYHLLGGWQKKEQRDVPDMP